MNGDTTQEPTPVDPEATLLSVFIDAAGPGIENQMKAVRCLMDGYSMALDECWNGPVLQKISQADQESCAEAIAEDASYFAEMEKMKESASTLAAVLARVLCVRPQNWNG